ncbi:hypothetical protein L1987_49589 [Smallanthus sonchifolius]|uniref:Uncharacterized protein n=1 Tax=Smallanthus sonchifolius TaxID=185202 RepID=A0ACB9FW25_9ASTR|nr:hypothetical protein L1987_49589 [Smallanthus sonchifolius]
MVRHITWYPYSLPYFLPQVDFLRSLLDCSPINMKEKCTRFCGKTSLKMKRYTNTPPSHSDTNRKNPQVGVQERGPTTGLEKTEMVGPPPAKVVAEKSKPPMVADIDQSAEEFIMKFRKQLMIQRMESIDNYHKMLARGT